MKHKIFIFLISVFFAQGFAEAQDSLAVPYGSFEQWTTHPGYSVTVAIVPVSVYSSFSTPTGWNHLSYPVNETFSTGFSNITVNTDLPLIKASQETGAVPHGSSAVKLETFMLSDIISSLVYSMASGNLDTTLTNTVYPSILTTGEVNLEHFIPIMNSLMSNMNNMQALLATFMGVDINYYVTGGIALGDFQPTRLTGQYKYHSAISGDNGGVVLLGTRYNATLHRREIVGGGAAIDLTDCTSYSPFTVTYSSLHEFDSSYAEQAPDSLVIMLVSSASTNRQQGSYLCLDSLMLWHDPAPEPEPEPEPDTCAAIVTFTAEATIHEAVLAWSVADTVAGYELEYGPAGFAQGSGTLLTLTTTGCTLEGLTDSTLYDAYLRTLCNDTLFGDWTLAHFLTLPDTIPIGDTTVVDTTVVPPDTVWYTVSVVRKLNDEIDAVPDGLITGEGTYPEGDTVTLTLLSRDYKCTPTFYGWVMAAGDTVFGDECQFVITCDTTITAYYVDVVGIGEVEDSKMRIDIYPNPTRERCVVSLPEVQKGELRLYTEEGRCLWKASPLRDTRPRPAATPSNLEGEMGGGEVELTLPYPGVFLLQLVTPQGSVTQKIVRY